MTELTPTREQAIRARLVAATKGPWAAWTDQDGTPHMGGMLMVGVEAGVIPDGETWVEGADVNNPVAHTYTPEDREFIAHAREDIPALLAEIDRLRGKLADAWNEGYKAGANDNAGVWNFDRGETPNPYRKDTE